MGCSAMSKNKVVLENQIRKNIYNHIIEYPGVSFSTLKRVYDLNESTLRYHLNYLSRAQRITSKLENGKLQYFSNNSHGISSKSTHSNFSLKNLSPQQEYILKIIKHHPSINQTELMTKSSLKRHVLTYNITQLIDMGIVRKINNKRNVCYEYITDELLQYEMLKVLAIKFLNNEISEGTYIKLRNKLKKT